MVLRRRWRDFAVLLLVSAAMPAFGAAAGSRTPAQAAAAMIAAADDAEKARIQREVVNSVEGLDPRPKAEVVREIVKAFQPLTTHANEGNRLNASIIIARSGTFEIDSACIAMIGNKNDAAVRYWGARGLAEHAGTIGSVSANRVIPALRTTLAAETSGIVAAELVNALVEYNNFDALSDGLTSFSKSFETAVPDVSMLAAAAKGMNKLTPQVSSQPAATKRAMATLAARFASFTAQQYSALSKASADQGGPSADYTSAVKNVLDAATRLAVAAGATTLKTPTGASADELLFSTYTAFGSAASGNGGQLQTAIPGTPVPGLAKQQ